MHDGFLKVNKFSEPVLIQGLDAAQMQLFRLLLLEKGTFQSHPDMGIGILTKWRYRTTDETGKLSTEIETQIETYLPQLSGSTIDLATEGNDLYVKILHDNIVYGFKLDSEAGTFAPLY